MRIYFLFLILPITLIGGTFYVWPGPNGVWSNPNNWDPNGVPNGGSDQVQTQTGAPVSIDLDGNFTLLEFSNNPSTDTILSSSTGGILTCNTIAVSNHTSITLECDLVLLPESPALTFDTDSTISLSNISGPGPLHIGIAMGESPPCTTILSGTLSDFSGGVNLTIGTLELRANRGLGTGVLSMSDSTTLNLASGVIASNDIAIAGTSTIQVSADTGTLNGNISGAGTLVKTGVGTLTLSGTTSDYLGGTTISAGALTANANLALGMGGVAVADGTALGLGSGVTLANDLTIAGTSTIYINSGTGTLNGNISGAGSLVKTGVGSIALSENTSDYSGGTTISIGALIANANQALSTGGVSIADGAALGLGSGVTLANNLTIAGTSTIHVSSGTGTLNGNISGAGTLVKTGAGNLVLLDPTSDYAVGTTISAGMLIANANQVLSTGGVSIEDGAALGLASGVTLANDLTISGISTIQVSSGAGTLNGNISGAGTLVKTGAGNLVLSDPTSDYSLGTTISAGMLIANANQVLSTGSISIEDGAALGLPSGVTLANDLTIAGASTIQVSSGTGTLNGNISGAGTLLKTGAGNLVLSDATSDYLGGTTISAGTLIANASQTLGIGSVAVADGALLELASGVTLANNLTIAGTSTIQVSSGTGTLNGNFSGAGTLLKTGAGNLALSGTTSDYLGGTTISAGALIANANLALGIGSVAVADGTSLGLGSGVTLANDLTIAGTSTIQVSSGTGTLNGEITGSGILTKIGAGTLTLSGTTSDYSGGTTISAGMLIANANQALSTGIVSIADGAALGLGSSVTLANNLTIAGTSTIQVSSGTGTLNGTISGAGSLVKTGNGILALQSNGSCNQFNITAGTATINSSFTAPVSVSNGATLKGTGPITGAVDVNGGLTPGNSIGTLNIVGPLTLNSSSVTTIEVNSTTSSLVNVTGAATIDPGASLQVVFNDRPKQTPYTILSATDGVSGQFIILPTPGRVVTLTYPGNDVLATFQVYLQTANLTGNRLNVANYLNSIYSEPQIQNILYLFSDLGASQVNQVLDAISPSRNCFTRYVSENAALGVIRSISQRFANHRMQRFFSKDETQWVSQFQKQSALWANQMETIHHESKELAATNLPLGRTETAARQNNRSAFYLTMFGEWLHQGAKNQNPHFDAMSIGPLLGYDYYGVSNTLVGGSLAYIYNDVSNESNMGSGDINSLTALAYATGFIGHLYLEAELLGGYNAFTNKREISFPDFYATAKSHHNGWELGEHLGAGYDWTFSETVIEPFIFLDAVTNFEQGFSEHGASPLNMHEPSHTSTLFQVETGASIYEIWEGALGLLILKESLSYVYQKPFGTGKIVANIVGEPGSFAVYAFKDGINLISPSLEILYRIDNISLALTYQGRFGDSYQTNDAIFKLGIFF